MMLVGIVIGVVGWCSAYVGGEMLDNREGFKQVAPWVLVTFAGAVVFLASVCMVIVGAIRFFQYLWSITA